MHNDLLELIRSAKDLNHVFITTFNIDLIYVESVLLDALKKCGHPSLTICADAGQLLHAYNSQAPFLSHIGRRYRCIPIHIPKPFCFHPKVICLLGEEGSEVFLGSGNLTYGGFQHNAEIWRHLSDAKEVASCWDDVSAFYIACLERGDVPSDVVTCIKEDFSKAAPGDREEDASSALMWNVQSDQSLFARIKDVIGSQVVTQIDVISPYYDSHGSALNAFAEAWDQMPIHVHVQSGRTTLTAKAMESCPDSVSIKSIRSTRKNVESPPFIHAKLYAFICSESVYVFAGSANCSVAALMLSGKQSNAEMLTHFTMSTEEYRAFIDSEFEIVEEDPVLAQEEGAAEEEELAEVGSIYITTADYTDGLLAFYLNDSEGVLIRQVCLDDLAVKFQWDPESNCGEVYTYQPAKHIELVVDRAGKQIHLHHWVNDVFSLLSSSATRRLAQVIHAKVTDTTWNLGAWSTVMKLLVNHLQSDEAPVAKQNQADGDKSAVGSDVVNYDVIEYRLPGQPSSDITAGMSRLDGLQALLLRYFGVDNTASQPVAEEELEFDSLHVADSIAQQQQTISASERERKRAQRVATNVVNIMTERHYLEHRHERLLCNDLAVVATLLLSGRGEGWLDDESFFELTRSVWCPLFFDDEPENPTDIPRGWISRREEAHEDSQQFRESFVSQSLTAALYVWCFSCPVDSDSIEYAQFELAACLALARYPWLWMCNDMNEIANEIFSLAKRCKIRDPEDTAWWKRVEEEWNAMVGRGLAMRSFESALAMQSVADLRERIEPDPIKAGTLLWQGNRLGFCFCTRDVDFYKTAGAVPVLSLRSLQAEREVAVKFLMPVRALLHVFQQESSMTAAEIGMMLKYTEHLEKLAAGDIEDW